MWGVSEPGRASQVAQGALVPGVPVEVAPGVRRVVAPNPGLMTGPGTNTYLLGERRLAVIDPGPDDEAHLAVLSELVGDRLRWILVTHTHVDHSPLAGPLKAATGAEVIGFAAAPSAGGLDVHDPTFSPDRLLADGDRLATGEVVVEAVHTPGHTRNHLCFAVVGTGLLFSGDHVLSGSTAVVAPPDGDMAAYMESLERLCRREASRIAPGHGEVIEDPALALDQYLTHRRAREAQVLQGLEAVHPAGVTAEALVTAIYTDVPEALHPVACYSVWAHLRKLASEGLARAADAEELGSPWWSTRPSRPTKFRPTSH